MIPLVSIVMPSFNQAEFLEEAVESVFSQDVERLELVVMDGGSSDGSQRVLAKLASAHPGRLRWHSAPDAGPASALNAAVAAAHAPVIGWLNSDDLYAGGAVARALARFEAVPETVMVYGEGAHVDVGGRFLERYPTLPPETPRAAWADGCPVCQPTVFFRRDAFLALGGLDTSLRASFDYEFWLRLMAEYPGRIGFVDEVQARTRMHAGTITSRFRERVALEGLQVVSRHIGPAPAHWLLTHFTELAQAHPFDATDGATLEARCRGALDRARPWLAPETVAELEDAIAADTRIRLSDAGFALGVDADGWAREFVELRLQQAADAPVGLIVLHGEHVLPLDGPLVFEVVSPDGLVQSFELQQPGPFRVEIPVADRGPGARLAWRLTSHTTLVPASLYGNGDERRLAFRLTGVALEAS
jgi:hypothetical protein